jgi:hypothetical protein
LVVFGFVWLFSFSLCVVVFDVFSCCIVQSLIFSEQKAKEKLPQICSVKPQDRVPRIKDLPVLLQNDKAKKIMEIFRMKVDSNLIEVKASTVPQPWLQMPGVQDFAPQKSWGPETGRDLKYTLKGDPRVVTCYAIFDQQVRLEESSVIVVGNF